MNTKEKVKEIDDKVQTLLLEKAALQQEVDEELIKSLEWLKNKHLRLQISPISAAGIPQYELIVSGDNYPYAIDNITVFGDDNFYEYNVMYRCSLGSARFTSSSAETMANFISKIKCASIYYSEGHLKVLLAAERVNLKKTT